MTIDRRHFLKTSATIASATAIGGPALAADPMKIGFVYVSPIGDAGWTYLPYGPFGTRTEFEDWINRTCLTDDPLFFAIVDAESGGAVGLASYLNIRPLHAL